MGEVQRVASRKYGCAVSDGGKLGGEVISEATQPDPPHLRYTEFKGCPGKSPHESFVKGCAGDYLGVSDSGTKIPWRRELGLSGTFVRTRRAGPQQRTNAIVMARRIILYQRNVIRQWL